MPDKKPAIISAVMTIVLLGIVMILTVLVQMLALNGAGERQGMAAMGISLLCQGGGGALSAFLASRLTSLFIVKFNWNKAPAVIVAVILATALGAGLSFLSIIVSIPLAGIR